MYVTLTHVNLPTLAMADSIECQSQRSYYLHLGLVGIELNVIIVLGIILNCLIWKCKSCDLLILVYFFKASFNCTIVSI